MRQLGVSVKTELSTYVRIWAVPAASIEVCKAWRKCCVLWVAVEVVVVVVLVVVVGRTNDLID